MMPRFWTILAIADLAIPALERFYHNTFRKRDAYKNSQFIINPQIEMPEDLMIESGDTRAVIFDLKKLLKYHPSGLIIGTEEATKASLFLHPAIVSKHISPKVAVLITNANKYDALIHEGAAIAELIPDIPSEDEGW